MSSKATYKAHHTKVTIGKKSSRIARIAHGIPAQGSVIVAGPVSDNRSRTFRFSIVSASQQMRERNNAYQFFSID